MLSLGWLTMGWVVHDFHFSRTDMRWNGNTSTIQTTIRVFTDDLELALLNVAGLDREHPLFLGEKHEWAETDSLLHAWCSQHVQVQCDGTEVEWTWIGKEVELDVSYLHLESQPLDTRAQSWRVAHTLLHREFDDQVNEVHLQRDRPHGEPERRREMLTHGVPSFEWQSPTESTQRDD